MNKPAAKLYALGAILALYVLEYYTAPAQIASLGAEVIHRLSIIKVLLRYVAE
jgi:hypothetical protein